MAAIVEGTRYDYRKRFRGASGDLAYVPLTDADLAGMWGGTVIGSLTPPAGYAITANDGETRVFAEPSDVAYGANGKFAFKSNVIGAVTFNKATFGDPNFGVLKYGFFRKSAGTKAPVPADTAPVTTSKGNTVFYVVLAVAVIGGFLAWRFIKRKK